MRILILRSMGSENTIYGWTLIGIFSVRCFFTNVVIGLPVFFLPFISIPLKVNGILIICMFFTMNIIGSINKFYLESSFVNYWAHLGGYLFGFFIGYLMKLHREAAKESVITKANNFNLSATQKNKANKMYKDIIIHEPDNEEALKYMLTIKKNNETEMGKCYSRLQSLQVKRNSKKAMDLFYEYYPKYINYLPGDVLAKLGMNCFKLFDIDKAQSCFELAVEKKGEWQPKALLQLGIIFEEKENFLLASKYYNQLISAHGNDILFIKETKLRLSTIKKRF